MLACNCYRLIKWKTFSSSIIRFLLECCLGPSGIQFDSNSPKELNFKMTAIFIYTTLSFTFYLLYVMEFGPVCPDCCYRHAFSIWLILSCNNIQIYDPVSSSVFWWRQLPTQSSIPSKLTCANPSLVSKFTQAYEKFRTRRRNMSHTYSVTTTQGGAFHVPHVFS